MWAVGATLVHLVTGRPPYHLDGQDNGPLAVVYRIVNGAPPAVPEAGWLAPLIAATMERDPQARPTMAEVRDRLERAGGLAEQTMALPPVPPAPPAPPAVPAPGRRFPGRVAALVAAGAAAAVALVAVVALQGRGAEDPPAAGASPSDTATHAPNETTPAAPTATEMEEFARSYIQTADADPDAGAAMLTPTYRAASTRYAEFWGPMRNPRVLAIRADPAAMTVTYTYSYAFPKKGKLTETVTLQLEQADDGRLLIAGAA